MSLCFVLLLLLGLANSSPIAIDDDNSNETMPSEEIFLRPNISDQPPVGRTFLLLHLLKSKLLHKIHEKYSSHQLPFRGCICVPFYLCDVNGTIITDGSGIINSRYGECTGDLEVCCFLRGQSPPPVPTSPTSIPTTPVTIPTTPPTTTTTATTPMRTLTTPTNLPTVMPTTVPSTLSTIPTTAPTTPVRQICMCVPVFQCAFYGSIGGGPVIDPRQVVNTCIGSYVCCSNIPAQPPATFPTFTLPPLPPTTVPTTTTTTTTTTTLAPPTTVPPIIPGQSCICTLISACGQGYISISGAGQIDPRLIVSRQGQLSGSCGGPNSMCCKIGQPNVVYPGLSLDAPIFSGVGSFGSPIIPSNVPNGPLPPGAVILPGSAYVANNAIESTSGEIKNPGTPKACRCILMDQCPDGDAVTHDNTGVTDPRFGPCRSATHVCCRLQTRQKNDLVAAASSSKDTIVIKSAAIVLPPQPKEQSVCGVQNATYANNPPPPAGSAYFGEFPWMSLLLIRKPGASDVVQCGGSLINNRVVLTAAHCVVSCDPGTLIVRLGEWNTQKTDEPLPVQEISVSNIVVHPQYYSAGLYNDIALVILSKPITPAINVMPVCLPPQGQIFASGTRCFASGWGRNSFGEGGQYQTILRKVDLPIVDNINCEGRLRATRLGSIFQLHPGFICAGGESSKDTCYKDGGGPLVCQDPASGRFVQSGIVSWGIGCGTNIPGVYTNVALNKQWIDQQLASLGITN